jgi:hypothetical protein
MPSRFTVTSIFITATLLAVTVSGCSQTSTQQNQQPIEIISVQMPPQLPNPGGPRVEITLKNVSVEPVTSLTATLEQTNRDFDFNFNVTPSNPLPPDKSISATLLLIGGGVSENHSYPLTIKGAFQSGDTFVYTEQVQIV